MNNFKNEETITEEEKLKLKQIDEIYLNKEIDMYDDLVYDNIFVFSYVIHYKNDPYYIEKLSEITYKNDILSAYERRYLLDYMKRRMFLSKNVITEKTFEYYVRAYIKNANEFSNIFKDRTVFIDKSKRNQKLIFVLTNQFLEKNHAPTNSVLTFSYEFKKRFGMNVTIINTAEFLSAPCRKLICARPIASKVTEFNNINIFEFKNENFPFYQCKKAMPDIDEINHIIDMIYDSKPYFIISVGETATSEILNKIIPVVAFPMVASLPVAQAQFLALPGRYLDENDYLLLNLLNKSKQNIIENFRIPFDLPEKNKIFKREDFDLPEDKFLIAITGNRLFADLTEETLVFLNSLTQYEIYFIFVGICNNYESLIDMYPNMKLNSKFLGRQNEFRSVMELCDLFLNPKREGNGTSALLAMLEGIPLVTLPGNDVSSVCENYFTVNSYDEMREIIIKYVTDREFYEIQSEKAKELAEQFNKKENLDQMYEFVTNSPLF